MKGFGKEPVALKIRKKHATTLYNHF